MKINQIVQHRSMRRLAPNVLSIYLKALKINDDASTGLAMTPEFKPSDDGSLFLNLFVLRLGHIYRRNSQNQS